MPGPVAAKKAAPKAAKKKLQFVIDCSKPVEDKVCVCVPPLRWRRRQPSKLPMAEEQP